MEAGAAPGGMALNQEMLPGVMVAVEVMRDLSLEAYGLSISQVIQVLHQFVGWLADAAGSSPIELGPGLALASDLDGGYRFTQAARL